MGSLCEASSLQWTYICRPVLLLLLMTLILCSDFPFPSQWRPRTSCYTSAVCWSALNAAAVFMNCQNKLAVLHGLAGNIAASNPYVLGSSSTSSTVLYFWVVFFLLKECTLRSVLCILATSNGVVPFRLLCVQRKAYHHV